MPSSKILITSAYLDFTCLTRQICSELGVEAVIIEAVLEEAAELVKKIVEEEQIEVIISRGGTAAAISKVVDTPVVTAEATDFDLLQAFWKAKALGSRIGFLGYAYEKMEYDFDSLVEILGLEVRQYLYRNTMELKAQVEDAYRDGIEVIVGGGSVGVNLAQARGLKGVLVHTTRRAVVDAILRAKGIMEILHKDRESTQRLKTIIQNAYEGIVALDHQGCISVLSPLAERTLGIEATQVMGKPITHFPHHSYLARLYRGGEPKLGDLVRVGEILLVVNRVPIQVQGEQVGLVVTFQEFSRLQQLEQKIRQELHYKGLVAKFSFQDIVASCPEMRDTIERAKRFGQTDSTVLITGESGTGKELFAQSMHHINKRREGPFVAVNCGAIPDNLLESELFGYEEGAFTGAKKGGKPGLFELAHGGTIFLDEIGRISTDLQARLLRVLQEKEVMRLGGDRIIPVDVRVIAATNQDLRQAVRRGAFRDDLYYRLNVLNLVIPPLRHRKEDLPLLARHFLAAFNEKFHKQVSQIPPELMRWMMVYDWPGNVRELENFMERLVILADGDRVDPHFLGQLYADTRSDGTGEVSVDQDVLTVMPGTLEEMERDLILQLSERMRENKVELAKMLGISRTTLWKKLRGYHEGISSGKEGRYMLKK